MRTDHQALRWLFSLKEPKARIARWIEILSAYHFVIEYQAGKKRGNADALSRCPQPLQCECSVEAPDLQCGPCAKCLKRSCDMQSSFAYPAPADIVRRVQSMQPLKDDEDPAPPRMSGSDVRPSSSWIMRAAAVLFALMIWFGSFVSVGAEPTILLWCPVERLSSDIGVCRLSRGSKNRPNPQADSWAPPYNSGKLRELQLKDKDIGVVLRWKEEGKRPDGSEVCKTSPASRHYWIYWDSLVVRDGVLYRRFDRQDGSGRHLQLIVLEKIRQEVLMQMHDSLLAGHLGKKTCERILQLFYWFGGREDSDNWVMSCDRCAAVKTPPRAYKSPLGTMPVGAPLDRLVTDLLGPLPLTPRGNLYILVVTDYLTKWVEIFPVPDQTAVTSAEKILNEVIARYGCPLDLHSDQGRNYESAIFAELCRLLEILKTRTSPGNPCCNGQIERFNRTLVRMIKAYLKGQQRDWDRNLGCLAAAYWSSWHESTRFTPILLMLGREVRLPAEVLFGSGTTHVGQDVASYGQYVELLKKRMQHAHELARAHLKVNAEHHKRDYDAKLNFVVYRLGELVWPLSDRTQLAIAPKLRCPYEGPYLVLKRVNDLDYVIQLDAKGTRRLVHSNRLKPYQGQITLKWANKALKHFQKPAPRQ